ncbi:hypothetical protein, partial [Winogradskyella luteola]
SIEYKNQHKEKLNSLIFDLYELSYNEKQRIKDSLIKKATVKNSSIGKYQEQLKLTLKPFFKNPLNQDFYHYKDFSLLVFDVFLNSSEKNSQTSKKVSKYTLNEIFKNDVTENFLASQEMIYGEDCIYILKKDDNTNWTETKAFEDGREILKRLLNG